MSKWSGTYLAMRENYQTINSYLTIVRASKWISRDEPVVVQTILIAHPRGAHLTIISAAKSAPPMIEQTYTKPIPIKADKTPPCTADHGNSYLVSSVKVFFITSSQVCRCRGEKEQFVRNSIPVRFRRRPPDSTGQETRKT
jgi:hypothetical protein